LTHLKYYSKRSLDAFERVKSELKDCNCSEASNFTYEGSTLLSKSLEVDTYEDGRFYVKRAREKAKNAISELEICSKLTFEDEVLIELEHERQKLEEQQKQLNQKEVKIKQLLEQKNEKDLRIKKEKLIGLNEKAILSNIKAYNNMLSACECTSRISDSNFNNDDLSSKSLDQIKSFYLSIIEKITIIFLSTLNECKN